MQKSREILDKNGIKINQFIFPSINKKVLQYFCTKNAAPKSFARVLLMANTFIAEMTLTFCLSFQSRRLHLQEKKNRVFRGCIWVRGECSFSLFYIETNKIKSCN